jgi:hypothetical protein
MRPGLRRIALTVLSLIVVASWSTGCAGTASKPSMATQTATQASDGEKSANAKALSMSQFVSGADAVCAKLNSEIAARTPTATGIPVFLKILPGNLAIEHRGLRELGALSPPALLASAWQHIVADRRLLASELATLLGDAKKNDAAKIQALSASKKRLHANLRTAAAEGGFKDCGTVG